MRRTAIVFTLAFFVLNKLASAQTVADGIVDAREYSFHDGKELSLNGSWEFYWNKLLTPEDFKIPQKASRLYVPGSWHRQGDYPAIGFATYRLILLVPPDQRDLLLFFPVVNASAKIWLNGELLLEHGKVSNIRDKYKPKLGSFIVSLPQKTERVEVVLQVVNFSYFSGGIAGTPTLNKATHHLRRINQLNGIENFFAGSLIAMFIYQMILFFLYNRGKPYLWLGLICAGVAVRSLIVHGGSFLLPNLFGEVSWEFWKKLEFGSVYAIVGFFPLYIYHLFHRQAPRWPLMFFVGLSGTLCVAVIFTPQYTYGRLLEICHLGLLLTFIYAVYSITKAWRAGDGDARIILWGVLASFPFILTEILKNSRLYPVNIEFMYLVELGVLVFLLFQVYLLANHYAKAYKNLEVAVEERTEQLVKANTVKDRLLSVMSHDIKSPINSLRGILQLYNRGAIGQEEFGKFAQQVESDLNKTGLLVENILHWTNSQIKGIQVNNEKFNLHTLVEENKQLFQTVATKKNIAIRHNVPDNLPLTTDRNILNMVLRNLLANAIKFSHENGAITVHVEIIDKMLTLSVSDTGMGMDEDTLQQLLIPKKTVSKIGTQHERGTGLGLTLCRDYLASLGGSLSIESLLGKGSTFTITIPLP